MSRAGRARIHHIRACSRARAAAQPPPRAGKTQAVRVFPLHRRARCARLTWIPHERGPGVQIYLPIAEVTANALTLLGIGGVAGLLSGMFGVGGGFLITPLLLLIGIPPAVAVATGVNQVVASSVSGVLAHLRRGNVDLVMGNVMLIGGIFGSAAGIWVFSLMRALGQTELLVQISYVVFLGIIGALMLHEGVRALRRSRRPNAPRRRLHQHLWVHRLPLKMKFRTSGLYISVIPPLLVGVAVGVLAAVMGVGGGFLMVPAMIYILGMPTKVVVGTSLYQVIFVAAFTTVMHAVTTQAVDILLAVVLIVGGVVGAQLGTRLGLRLNAEQLRILLALMVLAVAGRIALDLVLPPDELYSIIVTGRP